MEKRLHSPSVWADMEADVQWCDLLRVPYVDGGSQPEIGLDCYGQFQVIVRRKYNVLVPDALRAGRDGAPLEPYLVRVGDGLDDLARVGDLLLSDPEERGLPTHCSTLVRVAGPIMLSCAAEAGPYSGPAWGVSNPLGVWRIAEEAGEW